MRVVPAASPANGPALRDIHLPPSPSWWPPAPGWWIVLVLVLSCIGVALWFWRRQRNRRASEHALLAAVDDLLARHRQQPQQLAAELHALLRRAALRLDDASARHAGDAWRKTLGQVTQDAPTLDALMSLETAMYRPTASFDVEAAASAVRRWLSVAWRHQHQKKPVTRPAAQLLESGRA
ncbi:DUF4381 domain-containing protein [Dyella jiangningensis]|uniref:DUF4381 domain-containing protein n=1 Tax=Dyella jiangningensis TaxID=1379159 RepID=A0A328P6F0_9GAMM|nr:DUF4381 domain-containing protein [Dyella jiangningensis]RAO76861.1 hypothetical protein CA260_02800 [Dyella jiangningensis]